MRPLRSCGDAVRTRDEDEAKAGRHSGMPSVRDEDETKAGRHSGVPSARDEDETGSGRHELQQQ
jgi:hypothetical protein